MKKLSITLVVALVLGLAFVSCDNGLTGTTETIPKVTEFFSTLGDNIGNPNITPVTSFTSRQKVGFNVKVSSPYQDLAMVILTIRRGSTLVDVFGAESNLKKGGTSTMRFSSSDWVFSPGSYTAEVYAEDVRGNKSDTLTRSFTVTQ